MAIPSTPSTGRRGDYGVENPLIPAVQALVGLLMLQAGATSEGAAVGLSVLGAALLVVAGLYLHASRRGRFRAWARELGALSLRGDEIVLDLGCGRGAVTTRAAVAVPNGVVVGVDLWGPAPRRIGRRPVPEDEIARNNAEAEGVADRVRYIVGDLDDLASDGNHFDLVLSGGGLSRLGSAQRRTAALDEAVRVVQPGGRILIGDVRNTGRFAARLAELGCEDVRSHSGGWETWYGGPWLPLVFVTARKPA